MLDHNYASIERGEIEDELVVEILSSDSENVKSWQNREDFCEFCHEVFASTSATVQHKVAVHSDIINFDCNICGKYLKSSRSLKCHKSTIHNVNRDIFIQKKAGSKFCKICNMLFLSSDDLTGHNTEMHTVNVATNFGNTDKENAINNQVQNISKNSADRLFICGVCNRGYKNYHVLQTHIVEHSEYRKNLPPGICHVCGKVFKTYLPLRYHLKTHEANRKKPFKCTYCNKYFKSRGALSDHENSHTGNRPFVCGFCGKGFKHSATKSFHIKVHHSENDVRTFKCEVCLKAFLTNYKLQSHIRAAHTNEIIVKCEICQRGFTEKSKLKRHVVIHYNEKPFRCLACGVGFYRNTHLTVHLKSKKHLSNVMRKEA